MAAVTTQNIKRWREKVKEVLKMEEISKNTIKKDNFTGVWSPLVSPKN